ncbi:MAG: hypothetical protein K0R39_4945 [Symbiobacteriaceae bacterium]|jgi:hypothetical protein|nr:hypothetical protein [Symbiobacteriaceae bacterium]
MEGMRVMPGPVDLLDPGEATGLLQRAVGARMASVPRGTGGLQLALTGSGRGDQLVWGTYQKDDGVLALFSGGRLLSVIEGGLGEIRRVQPLVLPGLPHFAIAVDDRVDEMVGAYLWEEHRRIYVWDGRTLREVYLGVLAAEEYGHARWENPRGHQVWRLRRRQGEITLQEGGLTEVTREQQLEAAGRPDEPLPPSSAFRPVSETRHERRLVWNARLRRFEAE